jgi:hypothetical protein
MPHVLTSSTHLLMRYYPCRTSTYGIGITVGVCDGALLEHWLAGAASEKKGQ